jgi:hypothetical protein
MLIRIQIQGFDDQKLENIYSGKKVVQEKSSFFNREHIAARNLDSFTFMGHFWPPGSGSDPYSQCGSGSSRPKGMRIQIYNTGYKTVDPETRNLLTSTAVLYNDLVLQRLYDKR